MLKKRIQMLMSVNALHAVTELVYTGWILGSKKQDKLEEF